MVKNLKLKWLAGATLLARGVQAGLMLVAALVATPASAAGAAAIDSGANFSCALTTVGGVQCWGSGISGQLGNGFSVASSTPVDVIGLTSGVSAIALGQATACAITNAGTVKCWGSNANGLLGNGNTTNSNKPVDVAGVSGVTAIAIGNATCAVLASGGVKCWGAATSNGQAGTALWATSVTGVVNAVGVAVGGSHTCVILNTGGVQCWGVGGSGQLGDGLGKSSTLRVDVVGINDAVSIVAGLTHTCYKNASGAVKCWGGNGVGQLGIGIAPNALTPTAVTGLGSGVISLSSGPTANYNCAVLTTGEVKCWGLNNVGQLGTGDKLDRNVPSTVVGLAASASAVAAGGQVSCAIMGLNIQCWGSNVSGELGAGNLVAYTFPVSVVGYAGTAPSMTPTTISPVTSNTPTYTWKPILGATSYRLNVNGVITTYTAAQAGCDGAFGLCTITGVTLSTGSYTWSVQGFNSFGNGPWSAGTTFRL